MMRCDTCEHEPVWGLAYCTDKGITRDGVCMAGDTEANITQCGGECQLDGQRFDVCDDYRRA